MSQRARGHRIEMDATDATLAEQHLIGPEWGLAAPSPTRMLRVMAERASASLQIERTLRAWRRRAR